MSFLALNGRTVVVYGVSNRRSLAHAIGRCLVEEGARLVLVVRSEERRAEVERLWPGHSIHVCEVENPGEAEAVADRIGNAHGPIHGLVHSIAYGNFSRGLQPFHMTRREDFLQAVSISAFSLVEIARGLRPHFSSDASVVTIGISSYVAASSYGYMSPVKAALEGCVRFLAKSFSEEPRSREVRFNAVNAGPLKTKSSAGIPGYLENYLFAEKLTMRKRALETREVADVAAFLLSPRSSGINAQGVVVNAGMDWNYFDSEVVRAANRPS